MEKLSFTDKISRDLNEFALVEQFMGWCFDNNGNNPFQQFLGMDLENMEDSFVIPLKDVGPFRISISRFEMLGSYFHHMIIIDERNELITIVQATADGSMTIAAPNSEWNRDIYYDMFIGQKVYAPLPRAIPELIECYMKWCKNNFMFDKDQFTIDGDVIVRFSDVIKRWIQESLDDNTKTLDDGFKPHSDVIRKTVFELGYVCEDPKVVYLDRLDEVLIFISLADQSVSKPLGSLRLDVPQKGPIKIELTDSHLLGQINIMINNGSIDSIWNPYFSNENVHNGLSRIVRDIIEFMKIIVDNHPTAEE